jgi:murein DD-endopeptidase MepM/ murein hydrolase activator NlpD
VSEHRGGAITLRRRTTTLRIVGDVTPRRRMPARDPRASTGPDARPETTVTQPTPHHDIPHHARVPTHHARPDQARPWRRMAKVVLSSTLVLSVTGVPALAASGADPATTPAQNPVPDALPEPAVTATRSAPSESDAFSAIRMSVERRERLDQSRAARADRAARIEARKERARSWVLPTASGRVTTGYGVRGSIWSSGRHTGIDFDGSTGDTVRAVHTGTVIFAGDDGAYGKHVKLRHSNGDETWYAHLSAITVNVGDQVTTRDALGRIGSTGNSTGSHLHFEVHVDGAATESNPLTYLRRQGLSL